MVLPFVDETPAAIRPSFRHGIDSISVSGHKMIGTPMPCGVLVAQRRHVDRVASAIAYLRSNDTTLIGSRTATPCSRSGRAAARPRRRRIPRRRSPLLGGRRPAGWCPERRRRPGAAQPAVAHGGVPATGEPIVRAYQLTCRRSEAHAIVTDALLDRFLSDHLCWWWSSLRAAPEPDRRTRSEPTTAVA
jgi:histidine decarboxylase